MNKPGTIHVPEWATHITRGRSGIIKAWSKCPVFKHGEYTASFFSRAIKSQVLYYGAGSGMHAPFRMKVER